MAIISGDAYDSLFSMGDNKLAEQWAKDFPSQPPTKTPCVECKGKTFIEYESGLIRQRCRHCNGTGEEPANEIRLRDSGEGSGPDTAGAGGVGSNPEGEGTRAKVRPGPVPILPKAGKKVSVRKTKQHSR